VEAESGQSSNRLFIIIAVALIGLICIGLLGLGAVLTWSQFNKTAQEAALQPTAAATPFPPTLTPTTTPSPTPTDTPEPTPTGTLVVSAAGDKAQPTPPLATVDPNATATNTPVLRTTATNTPVVVSGTATPELPGSGGVLTPTSRATLLWVGAALVLVLLIYGAFYRINAVSVSDNE